MGSAVWSVGLCHGDWSQGPRVVVNSARPDLGGVRADHRLDDPVTDGTLEAFLVVANSPDQDSSALGARTLEHLESIAANSVHRSLSVDGVAHDFRVSVFLGEQIAVGRLPGNIVVSVTARGVAFDSIELGAVDLAEYGIDPAGPMRFHLDHRRTPATF
ncbi:hypothetical protein [Frankia sp. CcI49]|uniref:hypothetical protein n=1 Tax=Frankia sp. CcI49 TaxID=1745382 RepID=UPI0010563315|nr:hypothetical protein [Frankia sp. CcI49]